MKHENIVKGSLCMIAGFFFVAVFAALFKAATTSVSILWATFVGYSVACLIQFLFISKEGLAFLKTNRIGGHAGRVLFGIIATILYVTAIKKVPLMNATLLFNTAPLFVPLFAIFLLKTKISLKVWGALLLGFVGVVIILRPDIALLQNSGNLIGLASGAVQATAFIFVKKLTTTEPIRRINFYFFFFSSLLLSPYVALHWESPSLQIWIWTISAGTMSFLAQLFIVKGYQYADASHVGIFQYASVIFSGIIGWLVWNQTPSLRDLIGACLVIAGGALVIKLGKLPRPKTRE